MSEYVLSEVFKNKYAFYESILRGLADANKNQGINSVSRVESDFIVQIDKFTPTKMYKELVCEDDGHPIRVNDDGLAIKDMYFKHEKPDTANAITATGDIPPLVFPFVLGGIVVEKQVRTFAVTTSGAQEIYELCVDDPVLAKKKEQIIDNAYRSHVLETIIKGTDELVTGISQMIEDDKGDYADCENIEEQIYYQSDASLPDLIPAIPLGLPAQLPFMTGDKKPTVKEALQALPTLINSANNLGVFSLNINETEQKFAYGFIRMPGSGTVNWLNQADGKVHPICEAPYVPVKRDGQKVQVSINGTTYDMNADLHGPFRCKRVRAFIENYKVGTKDAFIINDDGSITHPEYGPVKLKQIVVLKTHVFVVDDFQNHVYSKPKAPTFVPPGTPGKACIPIGWMQDEA
jgi:hypothetical protein